MVGAQGLVLAPDPVTAAQMVPMQLLEGVVEGVAVANTAGPDQVQDPDQVQVLVNIVKDRILVMVDLLAPVVPVVGVVEDKLEGTGDLVVMGLVVAPDLALAPPITTGMEVLEVQMLMAMVVAMVVVRMVGLAVVMEVDLGMVMPTPSLSFLDNLKVEPNFCCLR